MHSEASLDTFRLSHRDAGQFSGVDDAESKAAAQLAETQAFEAHSRCLHQHPRLFSRLAWQSHTGRTDPGDITTFAKGQQRL